MDALASFKKQAEKQLGECGVSNINGAKLDVIVNRLKLIVNNKDATLVSGTDPSELETVRKNFVVKHLGVDDKGKAMAGINKTVSAMSKFKMKNRAAFYYMVQEELG